MFDMFMYFDPQHLSRSMTSLRVFGYLSEFLYYVALPVFCLVTAYFRVEEVQATDAV
jgi:hypothetical protein